MRVGDLVRLKTETGPIMVVNGIIKTYEQPNAYICVWHNHVTSEFCEHRFSEQALIRLDKVPRLPDPPDVSNILKNCHQIGQ